MIELAIVLFAPVALSCLTRKVLTWAAAALNPRAAQAERTQSSQGTA